MKLHKLVDIPDFNYHLRCEEFNFIHLIFANDMLLFTRGDYKSVELLFSGFNEFAKVLGMAANLEKPEVFFGSVSSNDQLLILEQS